MSPYYDEQTDTTYYDTTMVVEFRQLESLDEDCDAEDMRVFLLYDEDEDLIYVYGSRKSKDYPGLVDFVKTFDSESHAYDFLNVIMGFDAGFLVNTSVYYMDGLTDYSGFDDLSNNASRKIEISGYDGQKMSKKAFKKYMSVLF
jgi:hypothetical protein